MKLLLFSSSPLPPSCNIKGKNDTKSKAVCNLRASEVIIIKYNKLYIIWGPGVNAGFLSAVPQLQKQLQPPWIKSWLKNLRNMWIISWCEKYVDNSLQLKNDGKFGLRNFFDFTLFCEINYILIQVFSTFSSDKLKNKPKY